MKIEKYIIIKQDKIYIQEVILITKNKKVYKNVHTIMNGELTSKMKLVRKENVWYLFTFDEFETHKYLESGSIFREVKDITNYLHLIL